MKFVRSVVISLIGIMSLIVLGGFTFNVIKAQPVFAQGAATATPVARVSATASGHTDCLSCHANERLTGKFTNGETISLYYAETQHTGSIHADRGLGCRACHAEQGDYPHPMSSAKACATCHWQVLGGRDTSQDSQLVFDIPLETRRDLSLQLNQTCQRCHQAQGQEVLGSAHQRIMQNGNSFAPVCLDCHGAHDAVVVSKTDIPLVCSKCHLAIYTTYKSSVHGAALAADANPDVPTCGDCHGIHVMRGPQEANFRADSINMCGKCHADEARMGKYGISTNVFNTYLDDFHGRTVEFSRQSKMKVDKATCYDCHGVHNILPPQDKASMVYPTNLQNTCQQCHPDADITFPQAWLSHKVPDWSGAPVLFAVDLVYKIMIPTLIGGFLIYIALDARRRIVLRMKSAAHK